MIARRFLVEGKVQGVFFRAWTVQQAEALGASGWVRNRRDGSVEVYAVGEVAVLDALAARLHEGSPASRVARVTVTEVPLESIDGFSQRPTAA